MTEAERDKAVKRGLEIIGNMLIKKAKGVKKDA